MFTRSKAIGYLPAGRMHVDACQSGWMATLPKRVHGCVFLGKLREESFDVTQAGRVKLMSHVVPQIILFSTDKCYVEHSSLRSRSDSGTLFSVLE